MILLGASIMATRGQVGIWYVDAHPNPASGGMLVGAEKGPRAVPQIEEKTVIRFAGGLAVE